MSHTPPMTLFEHYAARCAIDHQMAIRAARDLAPGESRTPAAANLSRLSIVLFERINRLAVIVAERGADAVFQRPNQEFSEAELAELFHP